MKKYKIRFFTFGILCLLISCKSESTKSGISTNDIQWLQGSWVSADSASIETWALQDNAWKGNSFSAKEGKITERLSIIENHGSLIFEATVLNQNGAKPVAFTLNNQNKDSLFFSNETHDFPQYLLYQKTSDSTLFCKVYSKTNSGFEIKFNKIKDK